MRERNPTPDSIHVIIATMAGNAQCQAAMPIYEELHQHAPILLTNGMMALVHLLDADLHADEIRAHHIHSFPTMMIRHGHHHHVYGGLLTYDAIVDYLNRLV